MTMRTPALTGEALRLASDEDVVRARHLVRQLAQEQGLRLIDQTKLVTAVSELARNTVVHGGGGTMRCETDFAGGRSCVRLTFEDEGPGIAGLDALSLRPLTPSAPLPEQPPVPIGQLLYRGRAALERAIEIREQIRTSGAPPSPEALGELYDLLDLALAG